jgi:hypothetical protein
LLLLLRVLQLQLRDRSAASTGTAGSMPAGTVRALASATRDDVLDQQTDLRMASTCDVVLELRAFLIKHFPRGEEKRLFDLISPTANWIAFGVSRIDFSRPK